MDCDGCERRVKAAVSSMKGVKTVEVTRKQNRVVVHGYVDPNRVLKRAAGAYDKKAPAGFVRNVVQAFPATSSNAAPEENFVSFFSDDNVHACSVM
ncbi:unnamed protein product [Linum tenue]|uniref:HMA domain-containing protein n=1 Tax=Linum tenue TaxID=586396 RepID=A0AAV0S4T6_9ROSI|nr:unnamed protein product [Linum tenue]